MQQKIVKFIENYRVEKKVPNFFLDWAFVVSLELPQKECFYNKIPQVFVNFDNISAAFQKWSDMHHHQALACTAQVAYMAHSMILEIHLIRFWHLV